MTIRDIAQAAGVSAATVSRIMNHKDENISQETRERVLQIVKESGYTPYSKIRDRLLAGNNAIGLAIPTLNSSFYAFFVAAVQRKVQAAGYTLMLSITGGTPAEETAALESFRSSKAECVLLFPGSREGLAALEGLHESVGRGVVVDHIAKNAIYPQVYRDREKITRQCTELLMETCGRVALALRSDCGDIPPKTIYAGYEAAMKGANLALDPSLVVYPGVGFDQSFDTMIEIGVDGIVCQDADIAGQVYAAAAKKGVQIPEDLSVISIEDAPLASQMRPMLTAACSDIDFMVDAVFRAMRWQIRQKSPEFTAQTIPFRINERESIAVRKKLMPKIVIAGSMNMDVVLRVPNLPTSGQTLMATQLTAWPGGKGANQALGVSRLGGSAHMLGCLGNDQYGRHVFGQLSAAHVDMSGVSMAAELPTGTAYINVCPDGSSTIVVHAGANNKLDMDYVRRHHALLKSAKFCLIQMEIPFDGVEQVLRLCKKHEICAILKPSPARDIPDDILDGLYMLVPNEEEASIMCPNLKNPEQQARYFLDKGVQNVIITMGAAGCLWSSSEGVKMFAAHPYPCVDATGASDVFISCLAVMLSEGKTPEAAIQAATWAASYSVAHVGVQNAIPDRKMLDCLVAGTVSNADIARK